CLQGYIIPYNF
nr:immunoglobulin light chain junction region [Macaca mulatta]MOV78631.1 immunoglobulin light chain junction region [Macaca mulatta]MOV79616.1 immunoglobulin light chain junction region [Macaca mulatta]MOV79738.1 immunoglobulin light chain junction region [Macaca mulatta]MOV81311.1 immunoglobulin light chain junction region [Macaca mulatta]